MVNVHYTKDYNIFKPLKGNRGKDQIHAIHLTNLEKSIQEKNLLHLKPIIVNEHIEIIDGHHRYEVSKKLDLGVYYMIGEGLTFEDAVRLTSGTTDWTLQQYVDGYALNDSSQYTKLSSFLNEVGISLSLFNALTSNSFRSRTLSNLIKNGEYEFKEEYEEVRWIAKNAKQFVDFMVGAGRSKNHMNANNVWIAIKKFMSIPGVAWNDFMDRVKKHHSEIGHHADYKLYLQDFITVYNQDRGKNDKNKLNHLLLMKV